MPKFPYPVSSEYLLALAELQIYSHVFVHIESLFTTFLEADETFLNKNIQQFGIMNPVIVPKEEESTSLIARNIPAKSKTESECLNLDLTTIKDEGML